MGIWATDVRCGVNLPDFAAFAQNVVLASLMQKTMARLVSKVNRNNERGSLEPKSVEKVSRAPVKGEVLQ